MYTSILVAMALDHNVSRPMLTFATAITAPGGTVTALHVVEEPAGTANARLREDLQSEGVKRAKTLFAEKLEGFPDVKHQIVQGHVARTILEVAGQINADCIVMGSHQPGIVDYLIGSTAARVVRHAGCSVHVYRAG
ncbi:MAG: universal stress protein [Pseudomonadota bacterium]